MTKLPTILLLSTVGVIVYIFGNKLFSEKVAQINYNKYVRGVESLRNHLLKK